MKICIGRLGYVGLPLAIQFAHSGAHAMGLNIEKSAEWNRGTVARFDLVLIGTNYKSVNYREPADWRMVLSIPDTRWLRSAIQGKDSERVIDVWIS